ncbi:MAG: NineTeen Complex (NTC) component [Chrysothrix sp. TS-e1954]|nr:MAG: NineTeen Complex (NTC) component [Chrysothrix sp. TS-e1954]
MADTGASRGPPRVKNKAASTIQISAEQLLREAVDRQEEKVVAPTQRFADLEELHEFQGRKRREFEDYVRRNRINMNNWLRYAAWELEQKEFRRARSVFERALDVSSTDVKVWLRYVEAEMKTRNINHARNLLDRAVTILPRVDKLWYKYVHMEQTLSNIAGTRQIFERWITWQSPDAWQAYISMEKRYGEYARVRNLYERYTIIHPETAIWLKWAKFEAESGTTDLVREVYGMAIETLGDEHMDEKIFGSYARFEATLSEFERARAIYKFALDRLPRSKAQTLQKQYTVFEKQHGTSSGIEDVVLSKRRIQYETAVTDQPKDYDSWLSYARLEEESASLSSLPADSPEKHDRVIETYERAIAQLPPTHEKRHWRRYIYLWLFYALYSESHLSTAHTTSIYKKILSILPHEKLTFTKLWLNYANFLIRTSQPTAARKALGQALGRCPKDSLYKVYIALELRLFEFARCRRLHSQRVSFDPSNARAWIEFAELERGLDDPDRARGIFEIAAEDGQVLDMPELLWKAWIDFEEEEGEYERVRGLYERLVARTGHVKVWISWATFELGAPEADSPAPPSNDADDSTQPISPRALSRARTIFTRAAHSLSPSPSSQTPTPYDPASRAHLLQSWASLESTHGSPARQEEINKRQPRRIKKRRKVSESEYEEYAEWVFPEDEGVAERESGGKLAMLLEKAKAWKRGGEGGGGEGGGEGGGGLDGAADENSDSEQIPRLETNDADDDIDDAEAGPEMPPLSDGEEEEEEEEGDHMS